MKLNEFFKVLDDRLKNWDWHAVLGLLFNFLPFFGTNTKSIGTTLLHQKKKKKKEAQELFLENVP